VSGEDLVTGATGFIGGHLARRLVAAGRHVRALCRRGSERKLAEEIRARVDVVHGDMSDADSLERAVRGATRIFHCAGEVSDWGPLAHFDEINVQGTRRLFEAARSAAVQSAVHLSSFVVFGVPSPADFDDSSPYGSGRDAYTRTKIDGERAALALSSDRGLRIAVLRPTVVYGPGSTWLEEPIRMMKRGAFFLIGGGAGTCHPCYVENLVDAMILAVESPRAGGRTFLVADDDPISFRDYFDALASLCGRPRTRRSIPTAVARALSVGLEGVGHGLSMRRRPLLTRTAVDLVTTKSRMSMRRIREELGFVPRFSFQRAIENMKREQSRGEA
jgi:nucleoside-diphosphate-sugar epimerase